MSVIFCEICAFDQEQIIYEVDNNTRAALGHTSFEDLPNVIAAYTSNKEYDSIHLFGPEVYLNDIADSIKVISLFGYQKQAPEIFINK